MTSLESVFSLLALTCAAALFVFRRPIAAAWREPALRFPVLVFESDDWGPGPGEDAAILQRIADLLRGFRDRDGKAPVMTIGVVLAVADTPAMAALADGRYLRVALSDPRFAHIRDAMLAGAREGVFALQLHAMEHYWPAALTRAAAQSRDVAGWLEGNALPRTETLPPPLQSRWVDAAILPARDHAPEEIAVQVLAEVDEFAKTFGVRPAVVVPPTFLWTEVVEKAWANAGVKFLVCPGRQFVSRDARGRLVEGRGPIVNGERGHGGIGYVVRDVYFEPERGHTAEAALLALRRHSAAGRPTLLEIHRSNFIGAPAVRERSLDEMRRLLATALQSEPALRFASTEEIARALAEQDPRWVHCALPVRLAVLLQRLCEVPRFGRLLRLIGLGRLAAKLTQRLAAAAVAATSAGAARTHRRGAGE